MVLAAFNLNSGVKAICVGSQSGERTIQPIDRGAS